MVEDLYLFMIKNEIKIIYIHQIVSTLFTSLNSILITIIIMALKLGSPEPQHSYFKTGRKYARIKASWRQTFLGLKFLWP